MDAAKAALDTAEARLAVNQKALALELAGPRREDVAQGEAQLRAEQAQLALLQQQLKDADLLAPLDAVVRSRIVEPGEMASPQKSAFTLAITDPKWVRAYVGEPDLGWVHEGMSAAVTVDAFAGRRFSGWVGFISPVAEFTPKSVETTELRSSLVYEIRVFVKDPGDELRLGMPATVHVPLRQADHERGAQRRGERPAGRTRRARADRAADCASSLRASDEPRGAGARLEFRSKRSHGELTALVGPDGAGKTTLMRLAAGLLRADGGSLTVLGIDVAADPQQVQDRISYMPQRFGLYEDLTVAENLDLYADLHGVSAAERAQRYPRADGDDRARRRFATRLAGQLSGGMKQKLGLACTLVRSPELLLLDEPTVGVDPLSRRELWDIVRTAGRRPGTHGAAEHRLPG